VSLCETNKDELVKEESRKIKKKEYLFARRFPQARENALLVVNLSERV